MTRRTEVGEDGGDQDLVPADDRRRAVGARLEGDRAAALERAVVADGVAVGRLELGDRDRVGDA